MECKHAKLKSSNVKYICTETGYDCPRHSTLIYFVVWQILGLYVYHNIVLCPLMTSSTMSIVDCRQLIIMTL